jgi:hypothetical protein
MGVTDASIAIAIAAARLHPVFRSVFAVGHPAIGMHGRMVAAPLACGDAKLMGRGSTTIRSPLSVIGCAIVSSS